MNKWVLLAGGAVMLAWGPFLYAELTSEPAERKARDLPSEEAESEEGATPVAVLEEEEEETEEPTVEAPSLPTVAAAELPAAEPAPEPEPQEHFEPEEHEAEEHEAQEHEAEEGEGEEPAPAPPPPPSGPALALKNTFETETRDSLWASEVERRLGQVFQAEDMPEDMFQQANCRRTVCRVELSWSASNAESYMRAYASVVQEFGSQLGVEPVGGADEDGIQKVNMYFLRQGYSLAEPE